MDKKQIRAICIAERQSALGSTTTSDLSRQRSDALDYYMGDMAEHMPVEEGSSRAVSSDVSDTIEGIMPPLMDIFTSGDDYCEFEPQGPEDEEQARQETDYVNYVFMEQNPGFMILYSMIKDACLSKTGIVKVWWEENEEVEKETYENLSESAYAFIAADSTVEIVEQTDYLDEYGLPRFDVTVSKKKNYGCVKAMAVPPEEFGISQDATTIEDATYCYHKYKKSASELIEMGFPKKIVENLPAASNNDNEEDLSRNTIEDETDYSHLANRAMRKIDVTEHYIRLDADGDGVAERLLVITAGSGDEVLDVEEIDRFPFHSICPVPMTHRFYGRSIAELVLDIQRIKTHLWRAVLDNASLLNNQRIAVGEQGSSENTLDDMLTNRPGGIIRMKDVSQLREVPNQQLGPHLLPLMESADQARETRTGVTRHGQGMDPDSLNKASGTATGFSGLMEKADMRIKLIARIFAETGIKSLFLNIHELVKKHQDESRVARLRNKWVEVDPRNWKTRKDMTVTVALGTGSKAQQLAMMNALLEKQITALQFQGGAEGPIVTVENVYNTLKRMVELSGLRGADLYFTEPGEQQPQQPKPDPEAIKAQAEAQQQQAKLQLEQAKAEADIQIQREKNAAQIEMEREKAALQAQLAKEKAQAELALAERKMAMEQELAQQRMAMEAQMNQYRANLNHDAQISKNRPGGSLSE